MSASSLSAIRAAVVRSVQSSKMPRANSPVVLNLLDGPVGVDPAFQIVWTRFRLVRRYQAHRPFEAPRIFRMLDLVAHGPVDMRLCTCFLFLLRRWGLSRMESSKVGFVLLFLPLGCLRRPIQHIQSAYFRGLAAQN